MDNHQQKQIKKYFQLLVKEFVKNYQVINITIHFTDYLESSEHSITMGLTEGNYHRGTEGNYHHQTNSKDMQHTFKVSFLNDIGKSGEEKGRKTLVHEFTHLYLFSTIGDHEHDDNFYSGMEYFENGLDKSQDGVPRKDKTRDRFQHLNSPRLIEAPEQLLKDRNQLVNLVNLIATSPNLPTLEQNGKIIKSNPLYTKHKKTFEIKGDNKELLDNYYSAHQVFFQQKRNRQINGGLLLKIISLVIVVSVLVVTLIIGKVREKRKKQKSLV